MPFCVLNDYWLIDWFLVPAYPGCPGKEAVKWLYAVVVHRDPLSCIRRIVVYVSDLILPCLRLLCLLHRRCQALLYGQGASVDCCYYLLHPSNDSSWLHAGCYLPCNQARFIVICKYIWCPIPTVMVYSLHLIWFDFLFHSSDTAYSNTWRDDEWAVTAGLNVS